MRNRMAAIPYENLALHYSTHRNVTPSDVMLDVQALYSLIVEGGAWGLMLRARLPEPIRRARMSPGVLTTRARATMPGELCSFSRRSDRPQQATQGPWNLGQTAMGRVCVSRLSSGDVGTRVWLTSAPLARDHLVNLVTLSSQRYLVDVGMNARGPIVPLPLISGTSTFSVSPRKTRPAARLDPGAYDLARSEHTVAT
ncbi:hypothetical protein HO133_002129 [Letharia lupina]|uniref:Uncharacterized protein n=1 Tax=Letharia lupina TaxID=560253 RepID=A0A8H6CDK1_9LECA|nr:uncharacterized protein HO133_002129 [Letharia lupina]KAF6221274.1 hypothetical protein HO133_002129 [Letharia lupina]